MPEFAVRPYHESDEDAVVALWQECGLVVPWNDPHRDIRRKLTVQRDLFLVGLDRKQDRRGGDGRLTKDIAAGSTTSPFPPGCQKQGLGRRMMDEAEARLRKLGCPKINLQVRTSNTAVIDFYKALGYKVDDVVSMGKRLDPGRIECPQTLHP